MLVATASSTSSSARIAAGDAGSLLMLPANGGDVHACRKLRRHLADRLAEQVRVADRDLEKLHARARRHLDLRLEEHERDVQEQDRPGHAERIGHRVADGGIVVAEGRDRGLQRRRAGARAREQPERVPEVQVHQFHEGEAHGAREQHADECDEVGLAAVRAGQAENELLAVLHADRVQEKREAERSDHGRGRGLRREPADRERHEQNRARRRAKSP